MFLAVFCKIFCYIKENKAYLKQHAMGKPKSKQMCYKQISLFVDKVDFFVVIHKSTEPTYELIERVHVCVDAW